ncbi:thiosulfate sulfurtransferase 18-like [Lolium rigidum]|uniref:thiosulfate sulfurtransferase 18-like n=1 Tax=Lolium rigidum TaxID=89674 RepID=UPI001F5D645B|nr:thiosulfate sulfurtransferase 18-like [Lolium rigidum]
MAPPPEEIRSESVPAPAPAEVVTVDVLTASELKQQPQEDEKQVWKYLDVRTEEEMAKGHLHNSLNVPYMFVTPQGTREKNPLFVEQVASLFTTDQHILIGCQSGKRSELACVDLQAAGFMNVKNVGGGYIAWVQNGLPVVEPVPTPPTTAPPTPTPTPAEFAT